MSLRTCLKILFSFQIYKSEKLFLRFSSYKIHTLDFFSQYILRCLHISQLWGCPLLKFSLFLLRFTETHSHCNCYIMALQFLLQLLTMAAIQGLNVLLSLDFPNTNGQLGVWQGWRMKLEKEATCSDRKAEKCFLSKSDFLQDSNFMTFFPLSMQISSKGKSKFIEKGAPRLDASAVQDADILEGVNTKP